MPNLIERLAARVGFTKAPLTKPSYATGPYGRIRVQMAVQGSDPRAGAKLLRNYSRNNEWVRLAINYRKQQIAKAKYKIVRTDDPKQPPDPKVVARLRDLFTFINPKRESLQTMFGELIEDIIVIDAGCVEKEKTLGDEIVALWPVDGSTIVPDPDWNGIPVDAIRYRQFIDGKLRAELRNDQLLYIMQTETTYSPLGWSMIETLVRAIEADLFGEQYDFSMLKQTAPAGLLSMGAGVTTQEIESFREFYTNEIAGSQDIVIFGGGTGDEAGKPTWTPFGRSNREQERQLYKDFIVKKIAAVMQIDKSLFNITDSVNRATSRTQQDRTDEGLEALANTLSRYLTREVVWEIDANHGFEFENLSDRDRAKQAEIDCAYVGAGIWTINQVRARDGDDPVEWGDSPFLPTVGPVSGEVPPSPSEVAQQQADQAAAQQEHDDKVNAQGDGKGDGGRKTVAPFVVAAARTAAQMRSERLSYLNALESSSTTNVSV